MQFPTNTTWANALKGVIESNTYRDLETAVTERQAQEQVVPDNDKIFNAFELTDFDEVKVVILGQDPYPNPQDAMGLAFSIPTNKALPKSLVNIFKELHTDLNRPLRTSGDLTDWANQGVLLLNTVLTNTAGERDAHKKLGWQKSFTIPVIKELNNQSRPLVFILWGKPAQSYAKYITNKQHLILESPHPSPLGAYRGFWDSKPFSKTNQYLEQTGQSPINWG